MSLRSRIKEFFGPFPYKGYRLCCNPECNHSYRDHLYKDGSLAPICRGLDKHYTRCSCHLFIGPV